MAQDERYAAGMKARRQVLGDAYVDRAVSRIKPHTREFQEFLLRCAWGEIWIRPGLDQESRKFYPSAIPVRRADAPEAGVEEVPECA